MNNEKWNQVDKLEEQSLPQSALEMVNQILKDAIKSGTLIRVPTQTYSHFRQPDFDALPFL